MSYETSAELFARMINAARELNAQSGSGALHIFVEDGNCNNEDIEFCIDDERITEPERDFAQRMLDEFTEEQRHGVWAFAQCRDLEVATPPTGDPAFIVYGGTGFDPSKIPNE